MVFAQMLFDSGKIEYINYQIYLNWFDTFSSEFPLNKVVYVKTIPENCHSRIVKRSRNGESNISLDYLKSCSNYHNNMLDVFSKEHICDDQLILDGNIDIYENMNQMEKWVYEINSFIKT
jgi:deoxyadenosine/deoxycytidine kinase